MELQYTNKQVAEDAAEAGEPCDIPKWDDEQWVKAMDRVTEIEESLKHMDADMAESPGPWAGSGASLGSTGKRV